MGKYKNVRTLCATLARQYCDRYNHVKVAEEHDGYYIIKFKCDCAYIEDIDTRFGNAAKISDLDIADNIQVTIYAPYSWFSEWK